MASGRIVIPQWMPAFDDRGRPIPDLKCYVYLNETTELAVIYADQGLTTPLPNPVQGSSSGQLPPIWQDSTLLFSVGFTTRFGPPGVPYTFDNVQPSSDVGGAANKADRDLANVEETAVANIKAITAINDDTDTDNRPAVAAEIGSVFGDVTISGGGELTSLDLPVPERFQDIPRPFVKIKPKTRQYKRADAEQQERDPDIDISDLGIGKIRLGRTVVLTRTFGMRDNATGFFVATNPPAVEEINTDPSFSDLGDVQAPVYGAVPPQVAATYPDIDVVTFAARCYGTRDVPLAVSSYTATTCVLAQPLPLDTPTGSFRPLTSFLQTEHDPWYRAEVREISADRKTITVAGWWRKDINGGPQPEGQVPATGPGLYFNVFTKGFASNLVVELLGPKYELVRDVPGQSESDTRYAWRQNSNNAFIPYPAGDPSNATKPSTAGADSHLTEKEPANFQEKMCAGEYGVVRSKGVMNYKGTATNAFDGSPVYGELGLENFVFGLEMVDGNGFVINTETGQPEHGDPAFAYRARGLFWRGYVSRDQRDAAFVVENGYINTATGFKYEAEGGRPFQIETWSRGQTWAVDTNGNMEIGQKKVITDPANAHYAGKPIQINYFTNGGPGANAVSYRHTVTAGPGAGTFTAEGRFIGLRHVFRSQEQKDILTISTAYGVDSHIDISGGVGLAQIRALHNTNPSANVDLTLTPNQQGILNFDYVRAGYSASIAANFSPDRIIAVNTPNGVLYIPAALSQW